MQELTRSRTATLGMIIMILFVVIAIFGPRFLPYDPYKTNLAERLQPPTWEHWMGTDALGRDLCVRMAVGARVSLLIGLGGTLLALVGGTPLGMVGAYYGGRVDAVIMRLMDVMLAFPGIILAITIIAMLGTGLINVMIATGVHSIPTFARLAHGCALSVKEKEYVLAARAVGTRHHIVLLRHILPNISSALIVQFSLRVATVILMAAGLGYVGLGAKPPTPEWGTMLSDARAYMRTSPHAALFPGMAIFLLVLSLNMFGDGLRDFLDPRLRGV